MASNTLNSQLKRSLDRIHTTQIITCNISLSERDANFKLRDRTQLLSQMGWLHIEACITHQECKALIERGAFQINKNEFQGPHIFVKYMRLELEVTKLYSATLNLKKHLKKNPLDFYKELETLSKALSLLTLTRQSLRTFISVKNPLLESLSSFFSL